MAERLELALRDGTAVIARPLMPDDRPAVAEVYRVLSPEGRYHRFWTRGETIGEKMLDRLLAVDPGNHEIWGVLDLTRPLVGVGGASWWRSHGDPEEAEIAVTVLDQDQGRGVGTLLLALMWLTARRAGIQRLVAHALVENRAAAKWMRDCGASGEWDGYKLIFHWDLRNAGNLPATPAAADLASWLATLSPFLPPGSGADRH